MDEQNEIIVLESQALEEPDQSTTLAANALIQEGANNSVNLMCVIIRLCFACIYIDIYLYNDYRYLYAC